MTIRRMSEMRQIGVNSMRHRSSRGPTVNGRCQPPGSTIRTCGEHDGVNAIARAARHRDAGDRVRAPALTLPIVIENGVPTGAQLANGVRSGSAPARAYIPELLVDVLEGRINPGRVLDYETDLDDIADAYAAMDERRAIKSLVRVGSV